MNNSVACYTFVMLVTTISIWFQKHFHYSKNSYPLRSLVIVQHLPRSSVFLKNAEAWTDSLFFLWQNYR